MRFVVPFVLILVASSAEAESRTPQTCAENVTNHDEPTSYCHIIAKHSVCEAESPLMRFARGSSEVTDSFPAIPRLLMTAGMPSVTFGVRGYAAYDEPGDQLALAKARGEALAGYLVRKGIPRRLVSLFSPELRAAQLGLGNIASAAQVTIIGDGVFERPSDGVAIRMPSALEARGVGCRLVSYHVLFEQNTVEPDASSGPWMERLAALARELPTGTFEIHAAAGLDEREPETLAAARALELQKRLAANGIALERIVVRREADDGPPAPDNHALVGPVAIVRLLSAGVDRPACH